MIESANPLLIIAIVLIAGVFAGNLAKMLKLPMVTGQIIAGLMLGPSLLGLFESQSVHSLEPLTHFALGLIALTVGSYLHIKKLRNATKRLLILLVLEATLTPLLVFGASSLIPGLSLSVSLLLAALAISTAPATIVAIVQETRSSGVFVKTLMAAVALNNIACISAFEIAHIVSKSALSLDINTPLRIILWTPFKQVGISLLLGCGVGLAVVLITRKVVRSNRLATASMIAILLTTGLAEYLTVSSLLACLFLGMTLVNISPDKEGLGHASFANMEKAIYAVFFTMAGMELDLQYAIPGGLIALLVVFARMAGKVSVGYIAMKLAKAPSKVSKYLGAALIPQAGVAVGLILIVKNDPAFSEIADLFLAVGLTSVILNELIGPIMTRYALVKSGEYGMARARLIDFIHEENVTTELQANTKEEAIIKLADLLIKSHHLKIDRDKLLQTIFDREAEVSTCIGKGLAIPHGILENEKSIIGVMGISREGLYFETPDHMPVHCMVLLATPPDQRDRHLEVLAALASAIGSDRAIQQQIYNAKSPAHVCMLLQDKEFASFNYLLDDTMFATES